MRVTAPKITIPFLFLLTLILLSQPAHSRIVYPQGLWPMQAFGQFHTESQEILSYYDFNRDRFVDILTYVSGATYALRLYVWSQQLGKFIKNVQVDLGIWKPLTALPCDLGQDGQIEVVMGFGIGDGKDEKGIEMVVYSVGCENGDCVIENKLGLEPSQGDNYPTVMLLQGKNALVYTEDGKIIKKTYQKDRNNSFVQQNFIDKYFLDPSDQVKQSVCANYANIFYIDYNGDCIQDVVIHCNPAAGMADLQFYKGNDKGQFKPQSRAKVVQGMTLVNVAIADINFDGLVDIILLLSDTSSSLLLELHYNTATKQKYLECKTTTVIQNYFPFHFIKSDDDFAQENVLLIQRIPLSQNDEWSPSKLSYQNFQLRTGDINNDGFLDLIIDGPNRASLFINTQCLNQNCGSYNSKFMEKWSLGKIRVFVERSIDGMKSYNGKLCKMSFFDLYQDGRMDLIGSLCPIDNFQNQRTGTLLAIYNSLPIDAFFIKITILENVPLQKVTSQTIDRKLNAYGAHADFFVTALNGQRIPACGTQLSHPGRSLPLPYIHTGLGRTNNYVQQLTVTLSHSPSLISHNWSPIVPNSQLIVAPSSNNKWILLTYISPTAITSIVFWFVVLILIVIGIWIARLTRREKIEDKENQDSFYTILR